MKSLRLVEQQYKDDCTIACLAMITGISYYRTQRILRRNANKTISRLRFLKRCKRIEYIEWPKFIPILEDMFNISSRFIRFESLQNLKQHCILGVCNINGTFLKKSHAVVFDAKNRKILDPIGRREDLNQSNVFACLEIGEE